jgi:hypothetical protein
MLLQLLFQRLFAERLLLVVHALQALVQLLHVSIKVVQPGTLHLCRLGTFRGTPVKLVPFLLPRMHRLLGFMQRCP